MLILSGSNALSAFRTVGLLTRLQAVNASIVGVKARYIHFIDAAPSLNTDEVARLNALLTYGDAFSSTEDGEGFVVIPRFGTISPWASKATDIAHNCGMLAIKRIERGVQYFIQVKSGLLGATKSLSIESKESVIAVLHDRDRKSTRLNSSHG